MNGQSKWAGVVNVLTFYVLHFVLTIAIIVKPTPCANTLPLPRYPAGGARTATPENERL